MHSETRRGKRVAFWTIGLPLGLFAAYVTFEVVAEIVRILVPSVVRAVTTN